MQSNRASLRERLRRGQWMCVRLLMFAIVSLTVAGCQSTKILTTGIGGLQEGESSVPFCLVAKRITYSGKKDTPETVGQVREHNAVGRKLQCKDWR